MIGYYLRFIFLLYSLSDRGDKAMKGLLLEELSSNYILNLQNIFDVLNGFEKQYNWLISDYECNNYPSDKIPFNKDVVFMEGEKLSDIINDNEIQFIWGVFSGFDRDISESEIIKYPIPFADGNKELWKETINTQNPLAKIEIVSWDSSLVLVISNDNEVVEKLKKNYSNAKDLFEYNRT